jgi:hypothetical protein
MMAMVRRGASAWSQYWFAPVPGYPFAAARILFGIFLLVYFLGFLPHVELMFSTRGVYSPYLAPDIAPSPLVAWVLYGLLVVAAVFFVVGALTPYAAPLLLLLFLHDYFVQLAEKNSSFDRLIIIFLAIFSVSNAGVVWSVDAARVKKEAPRAVPAWGPRLLRFQLIAMYFAAGLWKVVNPAWRDGTLLKATMQGPWASPAAFWLVQRVESDRLWATFSAIVIAFELLMSVALTVQRTRPWAIAFGAVFHLANCFVLVIPEFLVCMTMYPLFLPSEVVQRIGEGLARRVRFAARRGVVRGPRAG